MTTREEQTRDIANDLYDGMHDLSVAVMRRVVSPPELYTILGNLKLASGYYLEELLGRLADGVERSIAELELYHADGGDAAANVAQAIAWLKIAQQGARGVAAQLEAAHSAIAPIGYYAAE